MSQDVLSSLSKYVNPYEFECKLPGSGELVKFKPLTTSQMKKLLMFENDEEDINGVENILDEIINESVVFPETFNIVNQYLLDRFYLLVEIRRRTKGDNYSFTYRCPNCGIDSFNNINLSEFEIKEKNIEDDIIELNDNLKIKLDFSTRNDQIRAYEYINKLKLKKDTERMFNSLNVLYAFSIKEIYIPEKTIENPDDESRIYIIENSSNELNDKMKKWFSDNKFGIDFTFEAKCNKCNNTQKATIPIESFFD